MAFNLGDILLTIKANTDSLKKGLSDVQNMGEQTKSLGSKIQSGLNTAAVGLAAVGAGLTLYAKNATDFTVEAVGNAKALARTIGTTTEEASRLTAAFTRMGISAEDTTQMFGIFSKQIVAATQNTTASTLATQKLQIQMDQTKLEIKQTTAEIAKNGDKTGELHLKLLDLNNTLATQQNALRASTDSFQKLGISTVDQTGKQKDFNTILFEVADKFKAMPDGVDKTTIAMDLFGRSGKDMIKVLNLGSSGIEDLEKQADKLGLTLNEKTIGSVAKLVASQKDLKEQTDAMKISVGTATAPVLAKFNEWLLKVTNTALNASPAIHDLTTKVLAFGGPVAGGASSIAGFLGNLGSIGPKLGQFLLKLGLWGAVIAAVAGALYLLQVNFGIFNGVIDAIRHPMETLTSLYNSLYTIITILTNYWQQVMLPALMAIWAAIVQNLWPAIQQLWDALVRLYNALEPGLTTVLKVLAAILGAILLASIYLLLAGLNILIQVFSAVVSAISNVINWVANMIGWFGNLVGIIINTFKTAAAIVMNFPQAFKDVVGIILDIFRGLGGMILKALGNMGSLLYNVGRDLVQGFVNGIKDMLGAVKDAIGNVGSSAVSKMKSMLGIHSPSTVFAEIGRNVGAGAVKGILSTVGDVQDAMSTMLQPTGISSLPSMALSSGSMLTASQSAPGGGGNTTTNAPTYKTEITGPVTVVGPTDADHYIGIQNRNQELELMGMSPAVSGAA